VLFSGGVLAVRAMALPGELLSLVTPDRWAFEAIGAQLDLDGLLGGETSGRGGQLLAEHGSAFSHPATTQWLVLALFIGVLLVGARAVVARRTATARV
jgi:hypothetical protein